MWATWRAGVFACIATVVFSGCHRDSAYANAMKTGRQHIKVVREFNDAFPHAENWISYFSNEKAAPIWNCRAGIYGRYILEMQVDVTFDSSRHHVLTVGQPSIILRELSEIRRTQDGRLVVTYAPRSESKLDRSQLDALARSAGDFHTIGLDLIRNRPISGFDEVLKTD